MKENKVCEYCGSIFFRKTYPNSRPSGKLDSNWCKRRFCSILCRNRCLSPRGENHPKWRGGITPVNKKIRNSIEYQLWRTAVFERDEYTCIWCGDSSGGNLQADHIKPFADYPELRFAIDNGRTLCKECHKTTDTYTNKTRWK